MACRTVTKETITRLGERAAQDWTSFAEVHVPRLNEIVIGRAPMEHELLLLAETAAAGEIFRFELFDTDWLDNVRIRQQRRRARRAARRS